MKGLIPIREAEAIGKAHSQKQVIIVAWDGKTTTVTTWGETLTDCEQAAQGGNVVKRALGWPEELCNETPKRVKP